MTVLGWAHHATDNPQGVTLHRTESSAVLVDTIEDVSEPKKTLARQVACFDAGVDFLPACPARHLSLDMAKSLLHSGALDAPMAVVLGCGQLRLSLPAVLGFFAAPGTGRRWLRSRRDVHVQSHARVDLLNELAQQLGVRHQPPHLKGDAVVCDLLVPRQDAARLYDQLTRLAKCIGSPAAAPLIVTGLWPPYSFCDIPHAQVAA